MQIKHLKKSKIDNIKHDKIEKVANDIKLQKQKLMDLSSSIEKSWKRMDLAGKKYDLGCMTAYVTKATSLKLKAEDLETNRKELQENTEKNIAVLKSLK